MHRCAPIDQESFNTRLSDLYRRSNGGDRGVLARFVLADMAREQAVKKTRLEQLTLEAELSSLRASIKRLRAEWLSLKAGFNPDQPRDDHGRWTSGGGGGGNAEDDLPEAELAMGQLPAALRALARIGTRSNTLRTTEDILMRGGKPIGQNILEQNPIKMDRYFALGF